jgi:hypothetical protein
MGGEKGEKKGKKRGENEERMKDINHIHIINNHKYYE